MLTLVVAVAASGLAVRSETSCPSADDVTRELKRFVPTESDDGWVRVANLVGEVYVVQHAHDGREVRAARVRGETCAELATESARLISTWEPPATPTVGSEPELVDLGRPLRLVAATIGAAMGAIVPLVTTLAAPASSRRLTLIGVEALVGAPLTGLTALVGHYLAGGTGNYGASVGGAAIGVAAALLPLAVSGSKDWSVPYEPGTMVLAALLAVGTPALFLELSDWRQRESLGAAVVPVNGGAGVTLGGKF